MSSVRLEILQQLRALLFYHGASGIHSYPRSRQVMSFLRSEFVPPPVEEIREENPPLSLSAGGDEIPQRRQGTIEEIADEVGICRSCDLADKRIVPVPGGGGRRVRLFVVGGWLMTTAGQGSEGTVFGRDEDLMLHRMLQAIHLSEDEAFVSNIIKCGIDQTVQPKAENIDACVSYLERQIAATSPEIICTMGIAATRTLLHVTRPLSQLRGRFYQYHLDKHRSIPLLPTYHPTFLLKNPEMKRATWEDLQLIEKHLQR